MFGFTSLLFLSSFFLFILRGSRLLPIFSRICVRFLAVFARSSPRMHAFAQGQVALFPRGTVPKNTHDTLFYTGPTT